MMKQTTMLMLLLFTTLTAWASTTINQAENVVMSGESMDNAIELVEGENSIPSQKMGDAICWYKVTAKSMRRTKVLFTGYPVLTAYLGSTENNLGTSNPVDYINLDADQVVYIRMESTNEEELTATVTYGEPVPDITSFGTIAFNIEKNDDVPAGSSISITFPNRAGGADSDAVTLSYYIFSVKGGNTDGAPVNLGGNTVAEGTLSEGIQVTIDNLNIGKKYRLSLQSLSSGSHFAPGPDEQEITPAYVDFYFTEATGISAAQQSCNSAAQQFNIAGQRVNGSPKGIIIVNGKKHLK